jgi:hypothetical protein
LIGKASCSFSGDRSYSRGFLRIVDHAFDDNIFEAFLVRSSSQHEQPLQDQFCAPKKGRDGSCCKEKFVERYQTKRPEAFAPGRQ